MDNDTLDTAYDDLNSAIAAAEDVLRTIGHVDVGVGLANGARLIFRKVGDDRYGLHVLDEHGQRRLASCPIAVRIDAAGRISAIAEMLDSASARRHADAVRATEVLREWCRTRARS